MIEAWRREYNEDRTHSTIGDVTPHELINHYQNGAHLVQESNRWLWVINGGKSFIRCLYFKPDICRASIR
ncbi:MAG: hypothetical protein ACXW37_11210 [Nitrospira sp.]